MKLFALLSPVIFVLIVAILGFITPQYDHLRHTISRLGIERYGWIQALNLFQFAVGMYLGGLQLSATMTSDKTKRFVRNVFFFCGLILMLAALTPTDPIEDIRFQMDRLTPLGIAHYFVVFLFLGFAPFGIRQLSKTLSHEAAYADFGRTTAVMGFIAFSASILWFVFYAFGWFMAYRGIFQKLIMLWTILWILAVNIRAIVVARSKPVQTES